MVRRSPPRPSRCVAKEWRSACGVAVSGRLSAERSLRISRWTIAGLSGPPRAPRNSRRLADRDGRGRACGIRRPPCSATGSTGTSRVLPPLPVTRRTASRSAGEIAPRSARAPRRCAGPSRRAASAPRRCARRSRVLRQAARRPRRRAWRRWPSAAWAAISAAWARAARPRRPHWRGRAARESAAASERRRGRARACARRRRRRGGWPGRRADRPGADAAISARPGAPPQWPVRNCRNWRVSRS